MPAPTTDTVAHAATRGDLVAVVRETTDYMIRDGGGMDRKDRVSVGLGIVTSVKRDGRVRKWQDWRGTEHCHRVNCGNNGYGADPRLLVMSADKLTRPVSDVLEIVAQGHRWSSGHAGRPFDSVDALRAFLRERGLVKPH